MNRISRQIKRIYLDHNLSIVFDSNYSDYHIIGANLYPFEKVKEFKTKNGSFYFIRLPIYEFIMVVKNMSNGKRYIARASYDQKPNHNPKLVKELEKLICVSEKSDQRRPIIKLKLEN